VINQFEKNYIQTLLLAHRGNITRAANSAKKDRRAFVYLIRKHNIPVRDYKLCAPDKL
jgi:two-component system response regulator GlrR